MTQEIDTKKANKMLAMFMGMREGWWIPGEKKQKQYWNGDNSSRVHYPSELRYDRNWIWLMPVFNTVAKLPGIKDVVIQMHPVLGARCTIQYQVIGYEGWDDTSSGTSLQDATYKAIVKFVTWYNSTVK